MGSAADRLFDQIEIYLLRLLDHTPFDPTSSPPPTYQNCVNLNDCPSDEACYLGLCEPK